jgi:hypothetical protein
VRDVALLRGTFPEEKRPSDRPNLLVRAQLSVGAMRASVLCTALACFAPARGLRLLGGLSRAARFFGAQRPIGVVNALDAEESPHGVPRRPRAGLETPALRRLPAGAAVKVLVWNVQYGAGIDQHFFYDGGLAVSAPKEHVV